MCAFWESATGPLDLVCGAACDPDAVRANISAVAQEWGDYGRVAMEDGEVLGFIKYAPARYFPQARFFSAGMPEPDTVLIACMHIRPEARRRGLGKVLLQAALRDLLSRGERAVEAYGVAGTVDFETTPCVGVEFLLRNGFRVSRPDRVMPLMRLELKSLAAWTEDLQAVLDSLRIPLAVPGRIPQHLAGSGRGR